MPSHGALTVSPAGSTAKPSPIIFVEKTSSATSMISRMFPSTGAATVKCFFFPKPNMTNTPYFFFKALISFATSSARVPMTTCTAVPLVMTPRTPMRFSAS